MFFPARLCFIMDDGFESSDSEVRVILPTIIYRVHLKITAAVDDIKLYIIIQINSRYSQHWLSIKLRSSEVWVDSLCPLTF
jgi:hypothetical protein